MTGTDTEAPLDAETLREALVRFGGDDAERHIVARQARDLTDAAQLTADRGRPVTVEGILSDLEDAPGGGPAERWNWWLGSLEVAYGGYEQFLVRRIDRE